MNETTFIQVQSIFKKFFHDSSIELSELSTTEDIEGWDSLTHLELINEIEDHFKIQFSLNEIIEFKNVGELIDCIANKL